MALFPLGLTHYQWWVCRNSLKYVWKKNSQTFTLNATFNAYMIFEELLIFFQVPYQWLGALGFFLKNWYSISHCHFLSILAQIFFNLKYLQLASVFTMIQNGKKNWKSLKSLLTILGFDWDFVSSYVTARRDDLSTSVLC